MNMSIKELLKLLYAEFGPKKTPDSNRTSFSQAVPSFGNEDMTVSRGKDKDGNDWETRTWKSEDGKSSYTSISIRRDSNETYVGDKLDVKSELGIAEEALKRAVAVEDYDAAVLCRDFIQRLKDNGEALMKLDNEKYEAAKNLDYEKALKIKRKQETLLFGKDYNKNKIKKSKHD